MNSVKNRNISLFNNQNVKKAINLLALPNVVAMLSMAIYNFIDVIFVGKLDSTLAMSGFSISFPIYVMILAISQMIGIGASSYISRSIGENKKELANRTASVAIFLGLIISISITIIVITVTNPLLKVMGASSDVLPYAVDYSKWLIVGSTFTIMNGILNSIIRAEGNAKNSMIAIIIASVANMILDPIFIFKLDMGVAGASFATLIAQAIATLYLVSYFLRGKSGLKIRVRYMKEKNKQIYIEMLKIGSPVLIMQVLSSVGFTLLNGKAITYGGESMVAAVGIVNKINMIPTYIFTGFVQGVQPFASYNYGGKSYHKLQSGIKYSVRILLVISIVVTIILQLIPGKFIGLFTSSQEIYKLGVNYLKSVSLLLPAVALITLYTNIFQAIGRAKEATILSFGRQALLFIPSIFIMPNLFSILGDSLSWLKALLPYKINDGLYGVMYPQMFTDFITVIVTIVLGIKLYIKLEELQLSRCCCD